MSAIVEGVLVVSHVCLQSTTYSHDPGLPIMPRRCGGAVPALGSGVNRLVLGGPDARGLSCLLLRKLGTSEAELRGMGPGDSVACLEARLDEERVMLGGSVNTVSGAGAAPAVSRLQTIS